jgi:HEPN domain-containing protein
MPDDRPVPDDPQEWLNNARSNLIRARMMAPGVYLEHLCFDAQQAAEKAIKAVLIARGIPFPYTHNLAELVTLIEKAGEEIPPFISLATPLTRFAGATRYPATTEPVTIEQHQEAVALAEATVVWATERIMA